MIKTDNLYAEVVINESPYFYDEHGRLRVQVIGEQATISTADSKMDEKGNTAPSLTVSAKDEEQGMKAAVMPRKEAKAELRALKGEKKEMKMAGKPIDPAMKEKIMAAKQKVMSGRGPVKLGDLPSAKPDQSKMVPLPKVVPGKLTTPGKPTAPEMKKVGKSLRDFRLAKDAVKGPARNLNARPVRPTVKGMMEDSVPATDYIEEKINLKASTMGEVIKDFRESDAPQFKGKSKEKRRLMAIAAKLQADRGAK